MISKNKRLEKNKLFKKKKKLNQKQKDSKKETERSIPLKKKRMKERSQQRQLRDNKLY